MTTRLSTVGQALHIARKDVLWLRREILMILTLMAALAWAETHMPDAALIEGLVLLASNFVIARVVHGEAIPGQNQFWITRPYNRTSLVVAKLLLVVALIVLPLAAIEGYIVVDQGFSIIANIGAIACSSLLTLLCILLPVFCLATLTDGFVQFISAEFAIGAGGAVLLALLRSQKNPIHFAALGMGPQSIGWIRDASFLIPVAALSLFVTHSQYFGADTGRNRRIAICTFVLAGFAWLSLPWSAALGIQSLFSTKSFDSSSLRLTLDPLTICELPFRLARPRTPGEVLLVFTTHGFAADADVNADAISFSLDAPGEPAWNSEMIIPRRYQGGPDSRRFIADVIIDPAFYKRVAARTVTVRTHLYFTKFANSRSLTIPVRTTPVDAGDGIQCNVGIMVDFNCKAMFRWPRKIVSASFANDDGAPPLDTGAPMRSISYSPLPARPGLAFSEGVLFPVPIGAKKALLTVSEPVTWFHVEGDIANVRLDDFSRESLERAPPPPGPDILRSPGTRFCGSAPPPPPPRVGPK